MSRVGKRVAGTAGVLVVLLGGLVGGVFWLLATPSGFAQLARLMNQYSGGWVALGAVRGDLGGDLTLDRVVITTATQRIRIDGLRLQWQPAALRDGVLDVSRLALDTVTLTELKPSPPEPLSLPASLRLPLDVRVRALVLDTLLLVPTTPGAEPLRLRGLRAALDGRGDLWRLTDVQITTPWATARGAVHVGKDAPFALAGRVDAVHELALPASGAVERLAAQLRLSGSVTRPGFDLKAGAYGLDFLASGEAAPFAAVKLPRLVVAGQGIDPRRFAPTAPHARLAFSGVFQSDADDRLFGSLALDNSEPGRIDAGRLPFAGLIAVVSGNADAARADDLRIDLGAAGRLVGAATWAGGRYTLDLQSDALNLAAIEARLIPTQLRLGLNLRGDANSQEAELGLGDVWGAGWIALTRDSAAITIRNARFEGDTGKLTASGRWLPATQTFDARFDLAGINPAALGQFPRASLNLTGEAHGSVLPELRVSTRFTLPPGHLEDRAVAGRGTLKLAGTRIHDADIDLALAGNSVALKGAAGGRDDVLRWLIDAPALDRLGFGFGGTLTSQGRLSGELSAPQVQGRIAARGLTLPGAVTVARLDLDADLTARPTGPFRATINAAGIEAAGQTVQSLQLALDGTRAAHRVSLDARLLSGAPDTTPWTLSTAAAGGLDDALSWRGTLERLKLTGAWPVVLLAPVSVQASATEQRFGPIRLQQAATRIEIDTLSQVQTAPDARRWSTRGRFAQLAVAPLLAAFAPQRAFSTDLVLDGEWALAATDALDGSVAVRRSRGDVRLTDPAFDVGIETLALTATVRANAVNATLDFASRTQARVKAEAATRLTLAGGIPGLARTAPLTGSVRAQLPDLTAAQVFLPVGMHADAAVDATLRVSGTVFDPVFDGQLRATQLRFDYPEEGVRITGGVLAVKLDNDEIQVTEGVLEGSSGQIRLTGRARIDSPQGGIDADIQRFALTQRSDRRITVSGKANLAYTDGRIRANGALTVDRARLRMPEAAQPKLSSDVVVVGQTEARKKTATPLDLDLTLDLGEDFLFDGAGLDARLAGTLRVFTVNEALRGEGTIRVAEGRYSAYGQTLQIERGALRFVGPIDNPGLDILAVRKTETVTAGVQVAGNVTRPVATLYSDPALPDAEKLSWLVLGRGLSGGGAQDFALLQVAAGALLSQTQSVNVQAQVADRLGIDTFDVRAGDGENVESAVVAVGKRLSSKTLLTYEQSLDGLSKAVKIVHQLTPRFRLEAQGGGENSFDAFYSIEYD